MNIILTGATSFIGVSLTTLALEQGHKVLAVIRKGSSNCVNLPYSPLLLIEEASLADYTNIRLMGSYDVCIHLAWDKTTLQGRDDVDAQCKNIQYTIDAVRMAYNAGCRVFLGVGSQAEYGTVNQPLNQHIAAFPTSGYGIAKLAAGQMSHLLCKQLGIRHNWARILSVYGKQDGSQTLLQYVIHMLLKGEKPLLTPCEQIWDYLYLDDCAKALLAIAESGIDGRIYALGSGVSRILRNYIVSIRDTIDPLLPLGFGEIDYYPHQPMFLQADITDLIHDTGYKPDTSFEEGIGKTIAAVRESMP